MMGDVEMGCEAVEDSVVETLTEPLPVTDTKDIELKEEVINLPIEFDEEVEAVIAELLPSDDPLHKKDFSPIDYINTLFPTEQSLTSIDDVVGKMKYKIRDLDTEIRQLIREQTTASDDGKAALEDAQTSILTLFNKIKDIRLKAEQSETMVKEITRDIKQLDHAKKNLTTSITTLNHLHMLVGGVESLGTLTKHRQYGEAASLLQGVVYVMNHFTPYHAIPQIKHLSERLSQLQIELAAQIRADFEEAHTLYDCKLNCQPGLHEACLVVDELDERVKKDLIAWFVDKQLQDYKNLFREYDEVSWLDKCDRRYAWLKRCFLEYDEDCSRVFPDNWYMSARIADEFCKVTKRLLQKQMKNRISELDVKLLLFAIQKTQAFEKLLIERFEPGDGLPEEEGTDVSDLKFYNAISSVFEPHLNVYIESQDANLTELMEKFVDEMKSSVAPGYTVGDPAPLLPSSSDLFVFYKKCLVQCSQLSQGQALLDLSVVFQTHLRSYHTQLLLPNLPNRANPSTSIMSSLKDGMLKEDKVVLSEVTMICIVLCTAEYCLDTTQQLEDKLKEKMLPDGPFLEKVNFSGEMELFSATITNCLQLLVLALDNICEPALNAMLKVNWSTLDSVGDQSAYTTAITSHLNTTCPLVRDLLSSSRKYFTNYCLKFVNSFIPRYVAQIYKCKPVSTVGAEQLLLDTHSLKTVLLQLPSLGSLAGRKPPPSFTKAVSKGMSKAEMILKLVMAPSESVEAFVESYIKLLEDTDIGDFQKLLDMKGYRRAEQTEFVELFRKTANISPQYTDNSEQDSSRIRKLERLIKKQF